MAYTIVKSDGTTLTTIANGTINTSSTSISLPGRNYAGYGEYLDTNFVHMLENFADSSVPANPIRGQLWYNTTSSTMYICPTDGDTNSANWYAVTTTSSAGNASLGNLTVTGNILTNNITATNKLDANSISCNYLTANINANMANANFSGTANASIVRSIAITSGSQSTTGILTGVWTANGAGTPSGGPSGTAFYVTGGNLVIANTSSRGIVADYFYYGNGTPITFGGSYGNSNVAAYLPGYGGAILTTTTTATALTTGAAGTAGTLTGNWTLSGGSKLQANTVLDAAQSNITSVGVLTSLSVTGNITAASANIVGGNIVAGSGYFLKGDGGLLTNISAAAGTSIVNGTSNVVVDASGNTRIGIAGTSNVLVVASGGANITGYANVTTNAFIGGNANVVSNVNAGNFVGIFANGTSNVRMPASGGNVNLSVGGTSNVLVVTSTGVNVAGYANVTGTVFVGANANIVGNKITDDDTVLLEFSDRKLIYLKNYLYTLNSSTKYILSIINFYKHLLKSISLLVRSNIVHNHITFDSIVVDKNDYPLLSNFSFSINFLRSDINEYIKHFILTYDPTYIEWPLELHLFSYLITNKLNSLSSNNIEHIIQDVINNNTILKTFGDDIVSSYNIEANKYFKKYVNQSYDYILTDLLQYSYTWDNYALSILFLRILIGIHKTIRIQNKFIILFMKLLVCNIHLNPEKRLTIDLTINKFVSMLDSIEPKDYKDVINALK